MRGNGRQGESGKRRRERFPHSSTPPLPDSPIPRFMSHIMAQILDGTDLRAIDVAATALRAGEVVAFPTETVYGLGADALNERAVAQVFAIKNRPQFDPLIVHLADKEA